VIAPLRRVVAPVRWLVRLEIGIWRSHFLWVTRRVAGQGPGVEAFAYAKAVTPVIAAFIFVSLVELPVVHLLLPWETVRLVVLVVSVWGLLWMIGLLASMRVFPHLLDDHGLRLRYGTTADVRIPWDAVASVKARRGSVSSGRHVEITRSDEGAVLDLPLLKMTRVEIALRGPTTLALPDGPEEVSTVRCYADDPRAFVARARERLAGRPAREGRGQRAATPARRI
jgi:hypothetical protein